MEDLSIWWFGWSLVRMVIAWRIEWTSEAFRSIVYLPQLDCW